MGLIHENWLKNVLKVEAQIILVWSLIKREYFLADKIPNSPRGTKCSKIEKKVQFQMCVCLGGYTIDFSLWSKHCIVSSFFADFLWKVISRIFLHFFRIFAHCDMYTKYIHIWVFVYNIDSYAHTSYTLV